jgi:hypothetical protein
MIQLQPSGTNQRMASQWNVLKHLMAGVSLAFPLPY